MQRRSDLCLPGEIRDICLEEVAATWVLVVGLEHRGEGCFRKWHRVNIWSWEVFFFFGESHQEAWRTCTMLVETLLETRLW